MSLCQGTSISEGGDSGGGREGGGGGVYAWVCMYTHKRSEAPDI